MGVHLSSLDRLQNQCIHLSLRALASASIPAFLTEAKILPLSIRRLFLSRRYIVKFITHDNDYIFQYFFCINSKWHFSPTKLPLLCSSTKKVLPFRPYITPLANIPLPQYLIAFLHFMYPQPLNLIKNLAFYW